MSTSEMPAGDAPSSTADDESLEGEGAGSQVGIMYSHRTWIVPPMVKAVTSWVLILALGGLGVHEVQKRQQFRGLLVDSVVIPEDWGNAPAPEIALSAVYLDGKDGGGEFPEGAPGGKEFRLSSHKGKWVFVNFWATWCAPCRDEMPSMEMLNRRFKDDVVMVAVSVDDDPAQIARFFGSDKPSFAVVWDSDKRFANTYGSRKFPESYLISPDGRIAAKYTGPRDWYNQGTVQYFEDLIAGRRKPVG